MCMDGPILIAQSKNERENKKANFYIEDELRSIDKNKKKKFVEDFYSSENGNRLYSTLWPHIIFRNKGELFEICAIYKRLEKLLKVRDVDTVVVRKGVCKRYTRVIWHVCDHLEVNLKRDKRFITSVFNLFQDVALFLYSFKHFVLFTIDQIASYAVSTNNRSSNRLAMFLYPGREDSMTPVIKNIEKDIDIFHPRLLLSTLFAKEETINNVNYENINSYASIDTILKGLIDYVRILIGYETESVLGHILDNDKISISERQKEMVRNVVKKVIHKNTRTILAYRVQEKIIKHGGYSNVVVGGMHPREKGITRLAVQEGINVYYIPHSITSGIELVPPKSCTQFVASKLGKRYINESYKSSELPRLLVSRRPYFNNLPEVKNSNAFGNTLRNVVIATQPFKDSHRKEFLKHAVDVTTELNYVRNIVVKLHPSEEAYLYENILRSYGDSRIQMRRDNLFETLKWSDITVTCTSNVGIESVLCGSICISFNPFCPIYLPPAAFTHDSIPILESKSSFWSYLNGIQDENLSRILKSQSEFVEDEFIYNKGGAETISRHILKS